MIKRDITETVYEYDKEGKLVKKTVIETHEEEKDTVTTYPSWTYLNGNGSGAINAIPCTLTDKTVSDCAIATSGNIAGNVTITG